VISSSFATGAISAAYESFDDEDEPDEDEPEEPEDEDDEESDDEDEEPEEDDDPEPESLPLSFFLESCLSAPDEADLSISRLRLAVP
jgi:hypothetical protein